jgi:hypothetical protein
MNYSIDEYLSYCIKALVHRVQLDWIRLFTHLIARLKSNVIYHLVTLRFELQASSALSLNNDERLVVGELLEFLPRFLNERN